MRKSSNQLQSSLNASSIQENKNDELRIMPLREEDILKKIPVYTIKVEPNLS